LPLMLKTKSSLYEVGYVVANKDYLLNLEGLPTVRINDVIGGPNGALALVTSVSEEKVEALLLNNKTIKPKDIFKIKEGGLTFPAGDSLLGRIFNPLAQPIDGKGYPRETKEVQIEIEQVATGIATREKINRQFITGMTVIDTLIPIGCGQRELIFGEPRSGKTSFIFDLILNQKNKGIICIYVSIGKSEIEIKRLVKNLELYETMPYSLIIAAFASDKAPLISLAPHVGFTVAEYFQMQGKDVVLILDDFSIHAKYLREIALLSQKVPGRESYPGDIFYQQAHLMERAGNFNEQRGKGSITLFPVIETNIENFTNLIPTNVMASTDGHLFFSSTLSSQGQYPSVDIDRSVTRVGRQTQNLLSQTISDKIRSLIVEYQELKNYSRFGSDLSTNTQLVLKRGSIAIELLKQEPLEKIEASIQILLLSVLFTPLATDNEREFIVANKNKIIEGLKTGEDFKDIIISLPKLDFNQLVSKMNEKLAIINSLCQ